MKNEFEPVTQTDSDDEIRPVSGYGKMPLILLLLWIANIAFFFGYFIKYGLGDLMTWLGK